MKIRNEKLSETLSTSNLPLYWVTGDNPLFMKEATDLIRKHHREIGYVEREVFNVDEHFDWGNFTQSTGNLSLFSEQKIIELRLSRAKWEDDGKKAIQHYLEDINSDYLILISGPKLSPPTLKTKWFSAIEKHGAVMQIWPLKREELAPWLKQRLLRENIQAEAEAIRLLVDKVEGNLLAAAQEIEKLKLWIGSDGKQPVILDAKTVMQVVADSSRYNVYQLVDAALLGDIPRSQKMLVSLRNEGVYPLVVLAVICRELRSLLPMLEQKQQGHGINSILKSAQVWYSKKQAVSSVLSRMDLETVWSLLDHSRSIDQSIKGMSHADPWDELSLLLLTLSR